MADLSPEEFAALRQQGYTVQEIARFNPDSIRAQAPQDTLEGAGVGPAQVALGGASGALDAIGGLRGVGALTGLGGLAYGGKKLLDVMTRRKTAAPAAPPQPAPQRAAAPARSSALVTLTEDDIKRFPEFKNASPGEEIRRSTYEKVKFAAPKAPDRTARGKVLEMPKRTTGERGPSASPEQYKEIKARKQTGKSKRQIAASDKGRARVRARKAAAPPVEEDDMMAQLTRALEAQEMMTRAGVPKPGVGGVPTGLRTAPQRSALRMAGKLPGALGLLLQLADIQSLPQQMDESSQVVDEIMREQMRQQDPERAALMDRLGPRQRIY